MSDGVLRNGADPFLEQEELIPLPRKQVKKKPAPKRRGRKRKVPVGKAPVHPRDHQSPMNTPEKEPGPEPGGESKPQLESERVVQEEQPERTLSPSPEEPSIEMEIDEAPSTSMASTLTSVPEVSDEIHVDVEQPLPGFLPTCEKIPEKSTDNTRQLSSSTMRQPIMHLLHPASEPLVVSHKPALPPPLEEPKPMRELQNGFSMDFKPMVFQSAKMDLKPTIETGTEMTEESPMLSPLATTPKRSSKFGSTASGVLPPPQMVELPKPSFCNMPASTSPTFLSSNTLLPETTLAAFVKEENPKRSKLADAEIVALKAKEKKVSQVKRLEEKRKNKEEKEYEQMREEREKRQKKVEREVRGEAEKAEQTEKAEKAEKGEKMRAENTKIHEFALISECKFLMKKATKKSVHNDTYRSSSSLSQRYQNSHHSSSYERVSHPRFFNNGNDVQQYRSAGYRGNNNKEKYQRSSSSSNRDRRSRNGRRSRSRTSRSPSQQLHKRKKFEEREQMQRAPLAERTPGSTVSAYRSSLEMSKVASVQPPKTPMPPHQPYPLPGYEAYGMYDPSKRMTPYPPQIGTLPTNEKLCQLYDTASLGQLTSRLKVAQEDVDELNARIARKRVEEEFRWNVNVWAKARADNGDDYYYNKATKKTPWTAPTAEQGRLNPNDGTAAPDTTVEEEERHLNRDRHHQHIQEFKQELKEVVKPIVCSYLRNVRDATPDKTQWLIKMIVKEMYKRESAQIGFDHRMTESTEKRVRGYTKGLLDRKLKSDELWKSYSGR